MGCQFSKEEVVFRLRRNPDKNNDKNYARRTLEQVVPPAATSNESGGDTSNMWPGFPNESARQAFIEDAYDVLRGSDRFNICHFKIALVFLSPVRDDAIYAALRVLDKDSEIIKSICSKVTRETHQDAFYALVDAVDEAFGRMMSDPNNRMAGSRALRTIREERSSSSLRNSENTAPVWTQFHTQKQQKGPLSRHWPNLLARQKATARLPRSQESMPVPVQQTQQLAVEPQSSLDLRSGQATDQVFDFPRRRKSPPRMVRVSGHRSTIRLDNPHHPGRAHGRPLEPMNNVHQHTQRLRARDSVHPSHSRDRLRPVNQHRSQPAPVHRSRSLNALRPTNQHRPERALVAPVPMDPLLQSGAARPWPVHGSHQLYYTSVGNGPPLPRTWARQDSNAQLYSGGRAWNDTVVLRENCPIDEGDPHLQLTHDEIMQLAPSPDFRYEEGYPISGNAQLPVAQDARNRTAQVPGSRYPVPVMTRATNSYRVSNSARHPGSNTAMSTSRTALPSRYMRSSSVANTNRSSAPALSSGLVSARSRGSVRTPSLAMSNSQPKEPARTSDNAPSPESVVSEFGQVPPLRCVKKAPDPHGRPMARVDSMESVNPREQPVAQDDESQQPVRLPSAAMNRWKARAHSV